MEIKFFNNDKERWKQEYEIRCKVAKLISIPSDSEVLDVLVGYADFSRVIVKAHNVKVTAIEIVDEDIKEAIRKIKKEKLQDKVKIIKMDATNMKFSNETFDCVVNFIGWDDLIAFSGINAVEKVFSEMVRVLKKNGILLITFTPELKPISHIQKMDKELEEFMWGGTKKSLPEKFFLDLFKKYNIKLLKKKILKTEKRINPKDGKGLIKWFCKHYPRWYPKIRFRSYNEIINKFGNFIDKYGIPPLIPHVEVLIGKKIVSRPRKLCGALMSISL